MLVDTTNPAAPVITTSPISASESPRSAAMRVRRGECLKVVGAASEGRKRPSGPRAGVEGAAGSDGVGEAEVAGPALAGDSGTAAADGVSSPRSYWSERLAVGAAGAGTG